MDKRPLPPVPPQPPAPRSIQPRRLPHAQASALSPPPATSISLLECYSSWVYALLPPSLSPKTTQHPELHSGTTAGYASGSQLATCLPSHNNTGLQGTRTALCAGPWPHCQMGPDPWGMTEEEGHREERGNRRAGHEAGKESGRRQPFFYSTIRSGRPPLAAPGS